MPSFQILDLYKYVFFLLVLHKIQRLRVVYMHLYNPGYANKGIQGSQHPQSLLLKALLIFFFALLQLSSFTISLLFGSTFSLLSDSTYFFAYLCSSLLLFIIIASKALFHPCYIHVDHCNVQVYYYTQIECCIQPLLHSTFFHPYCIYACCNLTTTTIKLLVSIRDCVTSPVDKLVVEGLSRLSNYLLLLY